MIKDRQQHTPAQIRQLSEQWYARQIEVLKLAHGKDWERKREWLESYLQEELRQRLIARGWKVKK